MTNLYSGRDFAAVKKNEAALTEVTWGDAKFWYLVQKEGDKHRCP